MSGDVEGRVNVDGAAGARILALNRPRQRGRVQIDQMNFCVRGAKGFEIEVVAIAGPENAKPRARRRAVTLARWRANAVQFSAMAPLLAICASISAFMAPPCRRLRHRAS
jgi:hypothetical protein